MVDRTLCATTGSEDIKKYCKKEENSIMIFFKGNKDVMAAFSEPS